MRRMTTAQRQLIYQMARVLVGDVEPPLPEPVPEPVPEAVPEAVD